MVEGGARLSWGRAPAPNPRRSGALPPKPPNGHAADVDGGGGPGRDVTSRVMQRVGGRGNVCARMAARRQTSQRGPGGKADVSPVYGALSCSPAIYRRAVARARRIAIYRRAIARARRMRDLSPGDCAGARMAIYRRAVARARRMAIYRRAIARARRMAIYRRAVALAPRIAIYCGMASRGREEWRFIAGRRGSRGPKRNPRIKL